MSAAETRLTCDATDFIHGHMVFVSEFAQHAPNLVNVLRGQLKIGAALFVALGPVGRIVGINFDRRMAVKIAPDRRQPVQFLCWIRVSDGRDTNSLHFNLAFHLLALS
jgi:hypothetical protein